MNENEKKYQKLTEETDALQNEYASRKFSYDPEADAGYKEYARLMRESGKKAMEDTVGKASALTGGYANSFAASAGGQVYSDYMKQAADAQLAFRQQARSEFDAENQDILNRLSVLNRQKEEAQVALMSAGVPTEKQVNYAKNLYKNQGQAEFDAYLESIGITDDAMWSEIEKDSEYMKSKEVYGKRFSLAGDGGWNFMWGLDNNAKLTLDHGGDSAQTKTVKEWYDEFTTAKDENGEWKYAWHEPEDAKKFLLGLQNRLNV